MHFAVESARWTRGVDMSIEGEDPKGFREISLNLKPTHYSGCWYRLASGGTLLGTNPDDLTWGINCTVGVADPDAPWKGVARPYKDSAGEADRFLHISLKLSADEFQELWTALTRGTAPTGLSIELRDDGEGFQRDKEHFDEVWDDVKSPYAQVWSASFE
jgi:hypothetical protein